jgi:predicted CDP-diglyceride synthetase/phosphatidate cytidylyltransferase
MHEYSYLFILRFCHLGRLLQTVLAGLLSLFIYMCILNDASKFTRQLGELNSGITVILFVVLFAWLQKLLIPAARRRHTNDPRYDVVPAAR